MTDQKPRYYEMQRRGELIQFTATLENGCTIFSVQKFHEAWERRHFPELYAPLFIPRRRRNRNA